MEGRLAGRRVVLVKEVSEAGFVFYTNLESRKGGELLTNPNAALCFHWKSLRRQIRIEWERSIRRRALAIVVTLEADARFSEEEGVVKAINVQL